jgi:hypothetical protein
MGAAQQLWLLYGNHPEISDIQNLRRCRARTVPIRELVENKEWRLKEKTNTDWLECSVESFPGDGLLCRRPF